MTQEHDEQSSPPPIELAAPHGMEESSQGSFNPADEVDERPNLPAVATVGLLQQSVSLDEDVELEAELLFGACALFEGLSAEEVREVVRPADKLHLQAGELLFEQGQDAYAMYLIQSGEVQVRAASELGEDIILAMLGSGTIVGELALIDGGPRSATVESLGDCVVYRLSRDAFSALRRRYSPAAYKIIFNLAVTVDSRRRQAEARIHEVFEDPQQHIDLFESQVHELLARLRKV